MLNQRKEKDTEENEIFSFFVKFVSSHFGSEAFCTFNILILPIMFVNEQISN